MPLSRRVYRFPELPRATFLGLPGLLADSLPDKFGNALINAWLASQGRQPDSFNAVERLCYTGARGMGALEFAPAIGPAARQSAHIEVDQLVELASAVLSHRDALHGSFGAQGGDEALRDILRVGTSAGGARAKAVIAWNPQSYGLIEYAYYLMALACGIEINECRLFRENGRSHFMTRRFDRLAGGEKLHMQSLCALAHYDFNMAGAYSYEQALLVMRQLGLPMQQIEELFRRMAFNIVARNQDDHVKNIAFLMNKSGEWSLAPAFDMTYSFNPAGAWTASHQMAMNGKRDNFTLEDFRACARAASMKRGRAEQIVLEVHDSVARWGSFAERAGVPDEVRERIQRNLNLKPFS